MYVNLTKVVLNGNERKALRYMVSFKDTFVDLNADT